MTPLHKHRIKLYKQHKKHVLRNAPDPTRFNGFLKKAFALGVLFAVGLIVFPYELYNRAAVAVNTVQGKIDLKVKAINIIGNDRISNDVISDITGIRQGDNINAIDIYSIKHELEKLSWVKTAVIERVLPSTINIYIQENDPKAIYVNGDARYLISDEGDILEKIESDSHPSLVILRGEKANVGYSQVLDQLFEQEDVYKNIDEMHKISNRRWNIVLKNGVTIKLPENGVLSAMKELKMQIRKNNDLLSCRCTLDLRFTPEKIYVRL